MTCEGNVRFKTIVAEEIIKPRAIKPRENVSWVTRRAVIKLTYFSGFTTAIYRSSAKLHRFIVEAYAKSHLMKSTQDAYGWGQLQPPLMWQTNSEGATNAPTQKSATASETMSALVLVRSRRWPPTRSTVKPFPAIFKMDRIQPRIQNQVPILYTVQSCSWAFKFISLIWKKPVWLFHIHLVTFASTFTPYMWRTWYIWYVNFWSLSWL